MQTHSVFRLGILPADELRPRLLEMSRLQVSSVTYQITHTLLLYNRKRYREFRHTIM